MSGIRLDSFDVDESLRNGERTCKRQQDTKAVSSSRVEHEASTIHIAEENTTIDNIITKSLPASGSETSSKVENFQGDHGEELESVVADGISQEARNAVPTTNKEEQFEKGCMSDKEASKSSHQVIHDVPVTSRDYAPESTSEPPSEDCMARGELTLVSGGTENVTKEIINPDVTCKKLPQSKLFPTNLSASESNHTEKDKSERSISNEVVDIVQLAEVHLDFKECSNSNVSRKLLLDTQEIRENQNLKLKLPTSCRLNN